MIELPPAVVHIVDDDRDMRDSLAYLLRSVDIGVQVYANATEFLAPYRPQQPGCLLFDVRMPDVSGLELYERLVAQGVTVPVIFMTAYADVPMAVRALKSGALEFLEKPFNRQVLLERVQKAISEDRARREQCAVWNVVEQRLSDLTERERNVLELVLTGLPNKAVASKLDITERTVELRRASLMKKLEVGSAVELIRLITQYEMFSEIRKSTLGRMPSL